MTSLSIDNLQQSVQSGQLQVCQLVESLFSHIEALDDQLQAYRFLISKENAIKQASRIDQKVKQGQPVGKFAGSLIAVKNNICINDSDLPTECCSKMLQGFVSPYTATAIKLLQAEDAIVIGTTNMDEFAMGGSTEYSAFQKTRNPWDLERVPGGSSGGSAVAVAAQMATFALGSDTGGSIRQPASFCGVTGFKPSYGAISRYGLVAHGSSLDQIGVFAKTAQDVTSVFSTLRQHDAHDNTSAVKEYPKSFSTELETLKCCIIKEFVEHEAFEPATRKSFEQFTDFLSKQGVQIEMASLATTPYLLPVYYILSFAESSSNLSRFDGIRYGLRAADQGNLESLYRASRSQGFGDEVKRRIMLGSFVLSAGYYDQYYGKASYARNQIVKEVGALLNHYDLILAPVSPFQAFRFGEKTSDPLSMYLADVYSTLPNLVYAPAISIPSELADGLPVGVQLMAKPMQDFRLLAIAEKLQQQSDFHLKQPSLLHK